MEQTRFAVKICLFGDAGVGKTSLIRRYVLNAFDDKYILTIGTKVSRKDVVVVNEREDKEHVVTFVIWDIMGQKGARQLLQERFFTGTKAAIGVCDITKSESLSSLPDWADAVFDVTGKIPVVFFANKSDLADTAVIKPEDVREIADKYGAPYFYTSAKTGMNVEKGFQKLAELLVYKK
jgi:small GTP-binding protein